MYLCLKKCNYMLQHICFRLSEYVEFFCVTHVTKTRCSKISGTFRHNFPVSRRFSIVDSSNKIVLTGIHGKTLQPFTVLNPAPPLQTPGAVGRQGREAFPGIAAPHVLNRRKPAAFWGLVFWGRLAFGGAPLDSHDPRNPSYHTSYK